MVVNLSISHELAVGVFNDSVEEALNYKTITKAIIAHVEDNRFLLLGKTGERPPRYLHEVIKGAQSGGNCGQAARASLRRLCFHHRGIRCRRF